MNGRYIVLAIGGLALMLLSLRESNEGAPTPATVIPIGTESSPAAQAKASGSNETGAMNRVVASTAAAPSVVPSVNPGPAPSLSPSTRDQLKEFSRLKKKVFLDTEEKRRMSALTRDPMFLSSLTPLFDINAKREDTELNAAIDLLLDAATKEKSDTAASVLMGVIADASIEDARFTVKAREELGGIKAEIMFLWTAASPERAHHMEAMLPGPVSRKLWENVLNAQERNVNESLSAQVDE